MIYKVEQFVNEENNQVIRKSPEGEENEDGVLHMGVFSVAVPTPYGPQEAQLQFEFPEKYTLEKCFEDFDKLAQEEYERVLNEIREKSAEQKIVTPDNRGDIIIP